jgi:hypothetical protein
MEQDEATRPVDVGILSPNAVGFEADLAPQLIQQRQLLRRNNIGGVRGSLAQIHGWFYVQVWRSWPFYSSSDDLAFVG